MKQDFADNTIPVIIVGAGAAGLAAAYALTRANVEVLVLESRSRIGGRAWTKALADGSHAELGAEFIHGTSPWIWDLIEDAGLSTADLGEPVIHVKDMGWQDGGSQWESLEPLLEQLENFADPDRAVAEVVAEFRAQGIDRRTIDFFINYIQGFNAADINDISVHALVNAAQESTDATGMLNFRLQRGYRSLMQWLVNQVGEHRIRLNSVVENVKWSQSGVEVAVRDASGLRTCRASKLISTLPLGVWMAKPGELGYVAFDPPLQRRAAHLPKLQMGHALHITLEFEPQFLQEHIFNSSRFDDMVHQFVRAPDETIAVWWTFRSAQKIFWVGWLGGPRAEQLGKLSDAAIEDEALACFARVFDVEERLVKGCLKQCHFHNWSQDPFSRGAYAYIKVNGLNAQDELKKSIDDTLFFAGEMIPPRGPTGLVDGAIGSGLAAAKEIVNLLA